MSNVHRRPHLLIIALGVLVLAAGLWIVRSPHADHVQIGSGSWRVLDDGAGSVNVSSGILTLSPAAAIDSAQARSAVALLGSNVLSDYSYSLRVATQRLPDNAAPAMVRLLVRYTPPTGGYYVSHSAAGIELGRLDAMRQLVLARSATPAAAIEDSHEYRVDAEAATLRVFVDGRLWISYEDPQPVPSGRAGIWIQGARATITDASVGGIQRLSAAAGEAPGEPRISLAQTGVAPAATLPTSVPAVSPGPPATRSDSMATPVGPPTASPAANGGTMGWGTNAAGELSGATGGSRLTPERIAALDAATALAAGRSHSVAADVSGSVWTWGLDGSGQLGRTPATTCRSGPVPTDCDPTPRPVPGLDGVVQVGAGDNHSLALMADGTVWTWGANNAGQLGDGTTLDRATPVQVQRLDNVSRIAAGHAFSLALEADGTVWAWGANEAGQLGDGTDAASPTPVRVRELDGVVAIAAGDYFGLGLKSNGSVWAWGADEYGQLGLGAPSPGRNAPVPVAGLGSTTAIAAGGYHALAIDAAGVTWAWGANWYGELGSATTETCLWDARPHPCSSTPLPVAGLPGAVGSVAAGEFHSLVRLRDGHAWAWGLNADGELGDGTVVTSSRPVQVLRLSSVSLVTAGGQHSLAASPARDLPTSHADPPATP